MNRVSAVAVSAAFTLGLVATASAGDPAVEKGEKVYAAAMPKCKVCHSIGGVGNAKGALDGVGSKLKADEIKAWVRTPREMTEKAKATRKPVMAAYAADKLSDADLDALTAYLLSLKK
jgi:mono/diheme cytochrome c family protein